jgi:hypothetical protein
VIGQAALTGLHRWIVHDIVDECEEEDEVLLEMKGQFCAGIQVFMLFLSCSITISFPIPRVHLKMLAS